MKGLHITGSNIHNVGESINDGLGDVKEGLTMGMIAVAIGIVAGARQDWILVEGQVSLDSKCSRRRSIHFNKAKFVIHPYRSISFHFTIRRHWDGVNTFSLPYPFSCRLITLLVVYQNVRASGWLFYASFRQRRAL